MSSIIQEAMNTFAKLIPGGQNVASSGTTGTTPSPLSVADQFASFGKSLAGTPGEISGRLFGTGLTVVGSLLFAPLFGFSSPPTQPRPVTQSTPPSSSPPTRSVSQQPLPAQSRPPVAKPVAPEVVPISALTVSMKEVFSLNLVGKAKFGENPQYTGIQVDLYDLNGQWRGFLTGLQLSFSPVPKLLQPPPPPEEPIDQPPVPREEVTEWTNGQYIFTDGSTIVTEGTARSLLVPQKDGSVLFMISNSHVVTGGTGRYEGVQGIKQGLGSVFLPPGEVPTRFPSPGYEFSLTLIDTFQLINKSFLNPQENRTDNVKGDSV